MFSSLKNYLYRHLFSIAPESLRQIYFRTKVLVPKKVLTQKFSEAIEFLKHNGPINDYLEFGVFRGDSLICMYQALKQHKINHSRLFGFDSFEGLPEIKDKYDKKLPWQKGEFVSALATTRGNLNRAHVNWNRVFLIKGYFNNTLNKNLIDKHNLKSASIIMIDCDLYSSAREALDFCASMINDRTIIFFDDWAAGGEKLAFNKMLKANPDLIAQEFGSYVHSEQKNPYTAKIFLVTRKKRKN
ncbi:MAG: hypothetical protein UV73_C0002G0052 [Candidatus Gottesmanbacteria bacterium GW2011_GWA2_43_14]|uniref:Methyltransferase n=1 Tax=Candidatus Gottesmanbacteria bacterium GW2011_GWA2_43_14 TaxID=1618443 RepID=A0A0G1GHR9_9BACT|nr:MAG: hypothetical protein UV73_C0002G0052 [Candidatus Gottesmanbacteria bacterium GW2011_GWA2_43_14]